VIKVTDRKPAENISLEQAKPQVLSFLQQQKREAAMQELAKELREKADVKINLP
jgi:parvulin-like peptidyl-prolyl isomerase